MNKILFATLALAAAAAIAPSANASVYLFELTNDPSVTGQFNYTGSNPSGLVLNQTYNPDSVTAPANNKPFFPAGTYTAEGSFGSSYYFDTIILVGSHHTPEQVNVDLEEINPGQWQIEDVKGTPGHWAVYSNTDQPLTDTSPAPEPSSLVLMGSGLFLLAGGLFAKSRSSKAAGMTIA